MSKNLKEAIERNDADAVRKALKTVKNLERSLPKADPPLEYACAMGADQAIAPLFEAGASVGEHGRPIRTAIRKGHLSILRAMAATNKVPPEAATLPLYFAAEDRNTEAVRALLEAFHPPAMAHTFYWPALAGNVEIIKLLVEHGVDVNARRLDELGALGAAGSPRAIQLLLDVGADPNKRDSGGRTPLMRLADEYRRLQKPIISLRKKLSEATTDEERTKWTSEIDKAADGIASTKLLLAAGADPSLKDNGGNDALTYHQFDCFFSGNENEIDPEFIELLKSAGGTGDESYYALIKALKAGDVGAVKQAIADGADVNRSGVPPDMLTPLMWCESAEAIKLLLDAGADPNKPSWTRTPLIQHVDDLDRLKMLLAAGADLHAIAPIHSQDSALINAYYAADLGNHPEAMKYLKSLGAGMPKRPDWKPIEPGIGLREDFTEIVIKGDIPSVAGGLAKMIGGTAQFDAYGKQFTAGKRAFVVVGIKDMNWCNVFQVAPRPKRSKKAFDKLCTEMTVACNTDVLYVEYSDASDCAIFVQYLPDGTSQETDTGAEKKEGTEEFDQFAATERLAVAQFSPGGDDKLVDVDFAEYPAEAFDGTAFVSK
jgi:ankyrin repeat protein